ncbi:50S ribosomal protein L23 [Bombilactobacillus thymidiniphilus]|uniref:Large ribosomal subunit protein uL23 n=1 Tax=Bombilactobacillus thymidiniphilus TaxID=2923363 RepID=A0ABY4PE91_9LACO|nr:50S ribosomal protein L23 [Bombilactobacillus thymidiniphilus]UQS83999.1 50S ribosomal protein L23 [Bombilactobacillus thymidiniphilus]
MAAQDIILRPVITEASMADMDDKKYVFDVAVNANKIQVRQAIEEIFDVKVANVNIMNIKPKKKRVGRYVGKTNKRRKAIIKLTEDSKEIKIFENQ